ncbi:helix-turn-helix transcriptional regulator [Pseudofrankia sp. DC12]|uniref:helix-turn-helix domain-containing protein n=1 Tax=Pseudofrankia sp. DC12 TaxID=683315 RepID=UPI0006980A81|nr:helix-turn-helix transcriptional regulator [Pseudofrankia sp. DC12]
MPGLADPRFGSRMRELRESRGLSLRTLAVRAFTSKTQLQAFESGKDQPSTKTVQHIDDALDAGGELVALASASARADVAVRSSAGGLEFPADWTAAVDAAATLFRRDVEQRARARGSGFDAGAYAKPVMRWLTAPFDERPRGTGRRPVGPPDVEIVHRATGLFRELDNQYGGGYVRELVARFLDAEVAPLLRDGRFDEPVGSALLSAAAELTQLAGWTSYDAGLHGLGQRYLVQALRLALAAADLPLGAEIIAAMSHQASYLGAAEEAVDLARAAARTAADAGVVAIAAEAAVLEAHGLALQGEERMCAVALDRAEHALDRADRTADPKWIGYFDEAYLSARFGHCFAALGRGDLAQRFAERSLEMDGRYVRGRQFNLALLARAHAQAGEVEQAATVGIEAASAAEGLRSARSEDYLRDLAGRLAPHAGLPAVDAFTDRLAPVQAAG